MGETEGTEYRGHLWDTLRWESQQEGAAHGLQEMTHAIFDLLNFKGLKLASWRCPVGHCESGMEI